MSTGKYSPLCPNLHEGWDAFKMNCYGETPALWNQELFDAGSKYDEKTMLDSYDSDGFDSYGYSAFDLDGNYVGAGNGIDRCGHTESDYLTDSANGGDLYYDILQYGETPMTQFVRDRN